MKAVWSERRTRVTPAQVREAAAERPGVWGSFGNQKTTLDCGYLDAAELLNHQQNLLAMFSTERLANLLDSLRRVISTL